MLFLQVFIRISLQVQGKFFVKFSMFLRAKLQILRVLKLQYDVNKIFACASVANKFVYLEFFFDEIFFCLETVSNLNCYIFLSSSRFFGELL